MTEPSPRAPNAKIVIPAMSDPVKASPRDVEGEPEVPRVWTFGVVPDFGVFAIVGEEQPTSPHVGVAEAGCAITKVVTAQPPNASDAPTATLRARNRRRFILATDSLLEILNKSVMLRGRCQDQARSRCDLD